MYRESNVVNSRVAASLNRLRLSLLNFRTMEKIASAAVTRKITVSIDQASEMGNCGYRFEKCRVLSCHPSSESAPTSRLALINARNAARRCGSKQSFRKSRARAIHLVRSNIVGNTPDQAREPSAQFQR